MNEQLKYNYVIFFIEEYYRVMFGDVKLNKQAFYVDLRELSKTLKKFAFNSKLPLFIRCIFFRLLLINLFRYIKNTTDKTIDKSKPFCFVMDRRFLGLLNDGFYNTVKKSMPKSEIVVLFTDLIRHEKKLEQIITNLDKEKCVDLVYSFDPVEAEKYGVRFSNIPASDFSARFKEEEEWDVVFLGRKKDRIDTIIQVWNNLSSRGLRTAFFLLDVSKEEQSSYPSGINFIDWISYDEYLRIESKSKVVLEIIQSGSSGNTLRVNEAIVLGKKLLTNNPHLKNNILFDPNKMFVFDDPADIPDEFFSEDTRTYSDDIKKAMSLQTFLERIDNDIYMSELENK